MEDEVDEVKLFRVQHEDESDAPSLADDKKDVALEEEMESKPYIGVGSAFHTPSTSQSLPTPFPFAPGMINSLQMAALNWQYAQQQVAVQQALQTTVMANVIAALSPGYPAAASPMSDMYSRLQTMAVLSPLAGPRVGTMAGMTGLHSPFRPLAPMQNFAYGGYGGGMGGGPSTSHSLPATPSTATRRKREREKEDKEEHIKKPKNAYFWYMEENRKVLMNEVEWKDKQSADLNKELGKRWHDMKDEEKKPYFEMAAKDKEEHARKYPNWSARENYANSAKKKKKRDRTTEGGEGKKCRAKFGVDAQERWCKHCIRKKKCLYTGGGEEDEKEEEREDRASSHSTHQRATDSESDLDDDPVVPLPSDEVLKVKMPVTTPPFYMNTLMLRSPSKDVKDPFPPSN